MKKVYRFNVHQYSPEQNKFEVLTTKEYNGYLEIYKEIPLPQNIVKQFTKDYKSNMQLVRRHYASLHDGTKSLKKHAIINFNHSNERINKHATSKKGLYNNCIDILEVINDFKNKNEGYKNLIVSFDSNDNAIYETVYNEVSYTIKIKVK